MEKIKESILVYFNSLNEFDKRTILRDCVDIFVFDRKENLKYYNNEAFYLIKLLRVAKADLSKKEFLEFVNKITEHEERGIDFIVKIYLNKAVRILTDLNNEIYKFKEQSEFSQPVL